MLTNDGFYGLWILGLRLDVFTSGSFKILFMSIILFIALGFVISNAIAYEAGKDSYYRKLRKKKREFENNLPRVNLKKQVV